MLGPDKQDSRRSGEACLTRVWTKIEEEMREMRECISLLHACGIASLLALVCLFACLHLSLRLRRHAIVTACVKCVVQVWDHLVRRISSKFRTAYCGFSVPILGRTCLYIGCLGQNQNRREHKHRPGLRKKLRKYASPVG